MSLRSLLLGCAISFALPSLAASDEMQATKPVVHRLSKTFIVWGNTAKGSSLAAGYNNIDAPMPIACGGPNGCTIEINVMATMGGASLHGTHWSICAVADGVLVSSPPCQVQTQLDNALVMTGNSRQSVQVAKGKHTVQTQLYIDRGVAKLYGWHIDYVLYRP